MPRALRAHQGVEFLSEVSDNGLRSGKGLQYAVGSLRGLPRPRSHLSAMGVTATRNRLNQGDSSMPATIPFKAHNLETAREVEPHS